MLALLLIREFQHVKLGGLLDLYDLYRRAGGPGRRDGANSVEGLLDDTYAQLAVTDFWRVRQKVTSGATAEVAARRFADSRAHTHDAIEALANSASLTPLGQQFVDEMRHSADM